MYAVGIDIGTTYTAAAVWRNGRAEIVPLGSHSAAIPSAVFLRPDGSFLTGESAYRRRLSEPSRVVREVKRRLGAVVAVYDLGGGTCDAAVLRKTSDGFDLTGEPEEIAGTGPAPVDPLIRGAAGPAPAVVDTPAQPAPGADEPTGEIPVPSMPAGKAPQPAGAKAATAPAGGMVPAVPPARKALFSGRVAVGTEAGNTTPPPTAPPAPPTKTAKLRVPILAAAAAVLLLAAGGTAWALGRSSGRAASDPRQNEAAAIASATASEQAAAGGVPAYEKCTDEMKKSTRWVCLTKATLHNNTFTVWYDAEWNGTPPDIKKGFHLHIYGGDGVHPDESTMGSQAVKHSQYYFEDQQPSVRRTSDDDFNAIGDADKVCARIAHSGHGLAKAYDGSYHTGNCVPIERY